MALITACIYLVPAQAAHVVHSPYDHMIVLRFKLGNLSAQYQRLATDIADPKFEGGPSPVALRYDATVNALFDWVAYSYGVDGHWYFMYGNVQGGLLALALGDDHLHTDYYLY